jgi:Na+/alanine symporter
MNDQFSLKMLKDFHFKFIMFVVMFTVFYSVTGFLNNSPFRKELLEENLISQEGISILIMALTAVAFDVSIIVKKKIEKANMKGVLTKSSYKNYFMIRLGPFFWGLLLSLNLCSGFDDYVFWFCYIANMLGMLFLAKPDAELIEGLEQEEE